MTDGIDEFELQRLLDGRMTETERGAFLECVDDQPHQWRHVALAYVEEHVLRHALQASDRRESVSSTRKAIGWTSVLARAAIVVFALFVGVLVGHSMNADSGQNGDVQNAGDGNTYVLFGQPGDRADRTEEVKASDIWADTRDLLTRDLVDRPSRRVIRDHGFDVSEAPVIYILQDGEGGHYVLPERHVSLVSHKE